MKTRESSVEPAVEVLEPGLSVRVELADQTVAHARFKARLILASARSEARLIIEDAELDAARSVAGVADEAEGSEDPVDAP